MELPRGVCYNEVIFNCNNKKNKLDEVNYAEKC